MGGIIDFDTSCPWELYLFALMHLLGAVAMYLFDACSLLGDTPCTDAEKVFQNIMSLSFLYVGAIYAVLTYHSKQSAAHITRLSNMALNCSVALLASVIFAGNASFGGIERSWMHKGDMLTMIFLVAIFSIRVSKSDAEWAQKKPLSRDLGVNCKALLLLFLVLAAVKFVAFVDFINPTKILAEGLKMTEFSHWMWRFEAVFIFEVFLAILYAVLYDNDIGNELLVITLVVMSLVAAGSIHAVQPYMSDWMGINTNGVWVQVGILVLVGIVAIVGGRCGGSVRSGYRTVSS